MSSFKATTAAPAGRHHGHKDKAKVRQQRALSTQLLMKQMEKVKDITSNLFHTSKRTLVDFPQLGVHVSFLSDFVMAFGGEEALCGLTTADVCEQFIKPVTEQHSTSYCAMMEQNDRDDAVGKAEVLISHAWSSLFLDVVAAIQHHFHDAPETVIWFDLFSINQHETMHDQADVSWYTTSFMDAIVHFDHTVLIIDAWPTSREDKVKALTRTWCLWELACTFAFGCLFEIALPPSQMEVYRQNMIRAPEQCIQFLQQSIDISKSEATSSKDREKLMSAMENDKLGFTVKKLNHLIRSNIRHAQIIITEKWLHDKKAELLEFQNKIGEFDNTVKDVIEGKNDDDMSVTSSNTATSSVLTYDVEISTMTKKNSIKDSNNTIITDKYENNPLTYEVIALHQSLANLFMFENVYDQAALHNQYCYEQRMKLLGPKDPLTLLSKQCYGIAKHRAKPSCSIGLHLIKEVVSYYEMTLGPTDITTLRVKQSLASAYLEHEVPVDTPNKHDKALVLAQFCYNSWRLQQGITHRDLLLSKLCLAKCLHVNCQYKDSEIILNEIVNDYSSIFGDYDLDILATRIEQVLVQAKLNNTYDAEALLLRTISIYEDLLGESHPKTIKAVEALAIVFGYYINNNGLTMLSKAEYYYEDAIRRYKKHYGGSHYKVIQQLLIAAKFYKEHSEERSDTEEHPDRIMYPQYIRSLLDIAIDLRTTISGDLKDITQSSILYEILIFVEKKLHDVLHDENGQEIDQDEADSEEVTVLAEAMEVLSSFDISFCLQGLPANEKPRLEFATKLLALKVRRRQLNSEKELEPLAAIIEEIEQVRPLTMRQLSVLCNVHLSFSLQSGNTNDFPFLQTAKEQLAYFLAPFASASADIDADLISTAPSIVVEDETFGDSDKAVIPTESPTIKVDDDAAPAPVEETKSEVVETSESAVVGGDNTTPTTEETVRPVEEAVTTAEETVASLEETPAADTPAASLPEDTPTVETEVVNTEPESVIEPVAEVPIEATTEIVPETSVETTTETAKETSTESTTDAVAPSEPVETPVIVEPVSSAESPEATTTPAKEEEPVNAVEPTPIETSSSKKLQKHVTITLPLPSSISAHQGKHTPPHSDHRPHDHFQPNFFLHKQCLSSNLIGIEEKRYARDIFKWILSYMGDKSLDPSTSILAQSILSIGCSQPGLRDEIYRQLMKQLTCNPRRSSLKQGWCLMSLCLSAFKPYSRQVEQDLLFFLRLRASPIALTNATLFGAAIPTVDGTSTSTSTGSPFVTASHKRRRSFIQEYAHYGRRILEAIHNVTYSTSIDYDRQKENKYYMPSIEEINAMELRVPVVATFYVVDGHKAITEEVPIAPHVTANTVIEMLLELIDVNNDQRAKDTLGLFVEDIGLFDDLHESEDDPNKNEEYYPLTRTMRPIRDDEYIGNIYSNYIHKQLHRIRFILRRRLYHYKITNNYHHPNRGSNGVNHGVTTSNFYDRIVYLQAKQDVLIDGFLCLSSEDDVVYLAAIAIAIEHDPFPSTVEDLLSLNFMEKYIPPAWRKLTTKSVEDWAKLILLQRDHVIDSSPLYLQERFVQVVSNCPFYGSQWFHVIKKGGKIEISEEEKQAKLRAEEEEKRRLVEMLTFTIPSISASEKALHDTAESIEIANGGNASANSELPEQLAVPSMDIDDNSTVITNTTEVSSTILQYVRPRVPNVKRKRSPDQEPRVFEDLPYELFIAINMEGIHLCRAKPKSTRKNKNNTNVIVNEHKHILSIDYSSICGLDSDHPSELTLTISHDKDIAPGKSFKITFISHQVKGIATALLDHSDYMLKHKEFLPNVDEEYIDHPLFCTNLFALTDQLLCQ